MIRRGQVGDLEGILTVKQGLRLKLEEAGLGGFLLGTTPEHYLQLIEQDQLIVLEAEGRILGFAVAWEDPVLRASEIWEKRHLIAWHGERPEWLEGLKLGYFDQLAILPGARRRLDAPALAMASVMRLFEQGHACVLTTTVRRPIFNQAAWPWLERAGGRWVGQVQELYPEVGEILSDVHLLLREDYERSLQDLIERRSPLLRAVALARALLDEPKPLVPPLAGVVASTDCPSFPLL